MKNDEIFRLLDERDKRFNEQVNSINRNIRWGNKGIRTYVDAGFEAIARSEKIRNSRIEKLEDCTGKLDKWKIKCTARNKVIWIGLSGIATFLGAVIVNNWNKIFN